MKQTHPTAANPGPIWGYSALVLLERYLPAFIFNKFLDAGTFVGLLLMQEKRRYSAEYWTAVSGHAPTMREQFHHFRSFMDGLILKLKPTDGDYPDFQFAPDAHKNAFIGLCESPQQILFGTFHVGYSDMMGCMLKSFDRKISMIRRQLGNSHDTEIIASRFSGSVEFLWINNPGEFIFQLKEAIESGKSIGLQCDRTEFASKLGSFSFLGARREFPTTIYSLANLFNMPVVFAFTGPIQKSGRIEVYTSPVFHPGKDRKENMREAKAHFQAVLNALDSHLRKHPELWFNFLPLNRVSGKQEHHA